MSDAVSVRKRDVVAYTSPERLIGLKTLSPARTLSQQQASQISPKLVVTTPLAGLRSIPGTILLGSRDVVAVAPQIIYLR
jgi:hypothetical protein